jgi:hypothetical protein
VRFGLQSYDEMGTVMFQTMTTSDADEEALDKFHAAIAKAVVKQVSESDTVKRLGEEQRQLKAGVAPSSGCGAEPPALIAPPGR